MRGSSSRWVMLGVALLVAFPSIATYLPKKLF